MPDGIRIRISSQPHIDYGLGYPVTYVFSIPSSLTGGCKIYCRKVDDPEVALEELPTKTSTDFFNGIECARFDYANSRVYVSVAFGGGDDIYLLLRDGDGNVQPLTYLSMPQYYDNRKCAFTYTADDYHGGYFTITPTEAKQAWSNFLNVVHQYNICVSAGPVMHADQAGINSLGTPPGDHWPDLQAEINDHDDIMDVVSHSYSHSYLPYDDYDLEVGTSKQLLEDNLILPGHQAGKVVGWIEPAGQSNPTVVSRLAQYKYLCQRSTGSGVCDWAAWATNKYARYGMDRQCQGTAQFEAVKTSFNSRYTNGQIQHVWTHPAWMIQSQYGGSAGVWTPGSAFHDCMDYIGGRKDVWYAPWGSMYMYHYVQERDQVAVSNVEIVESWGAQIDLSTTSFTPAFKSLENIGTWGVDIELSSGFGYAPPDGDSVNFMPKVQSVTPAWNEVNFGVGNMLMFPPFVLRTDWIHEPLGMFDCPVSLADLGILISPFTYSPPHGDGVNFYPRVQGVVAWNEVNWYWPVHMVANLGYVGDFDFDLFDLALRTDVVLSVDHVGDMLMAFFDLDALVRLGYKTPLLAMGTGSSRGVTVSDTGVRLLAIAIPYNTLTVDGSKTGATVDDSRTEAEI